MEPATAPRPDLFDIKFVRDELLYYSRDENQFLRRRRRFVVALLPNLARSRFKDAELPTQRIVLALAVLVVLVRKLTEWLSTDALAFDILFVAGGDGQPLAQEEALLTMLLREPIANGTVRLARVADLDAVSKAVAEHERRSLCHVLLIGTADAGPGAGGADAARLVVAGPRPRLVAAEGHVRADGDDAWEAWRQALRGLLERWV
jgi:hypothetical protein